MKTDTDRVETLIERYFMGATSIDEERALRRMLASDKLPDKPAIREARATMGFLAAGIGKSAEAKPKGERAVSRRRLQRAAITAASVAAAAAIVWTPADSGNTMVAYVGGNTVTSEQAILDIMKADIGLMSEGARSLGADAREQIGIFADAISELESGI